MRRDVIAAYVETLLATLTETEDVKPDHDGDYPVRFGRALDYVRIVGGESADVQVFAVAVDNVPSTPALLVAINSLNTRARFTRVFHVRDQVLVETDLIGETIEPNGFFNACQVVAALTDQVGGALAEKFGGNTAFEDAKEPGYAPPDPRVGMYL